MKSLHKQTQLNGALLMALAVGLGAFGAHGLENLISSEDLAIFKTGNFYHFIHGIGILIVGILIHPRERQTFRWIFRLFLIGIVLFSGSLYLLSTSSVWYGERLTALGMITPLGGLSFIVAWVLLALSALKKHRDKEHKEKEE